ncbi:MAG: cytochrome-c oxidase, cbb3-type subunit II, partial [Planctomycetota bacterium]
KTWRMKPPSYDVPVVRAAKLSKVYDDGPAPKSRLNANVGLGHAGDRFMQGHWHRKWERMPVRFTVYVTVAVAIASLLEIVPTFLIKSNVPTIASVKPYTPLELAGRDIYIAEGCYNCHSQMIRPIFSETQRYGEYSKPGEFIYDRPFQWGSRRIGPDLAREGGVQSSFWHYPHFENPQLYQQGSVMPSYKHLINKDMNFAEIEARVHSMAMLGVPYGDAVNNSVEMAREQAAQVAQEIRDQATDYALVDDLENKKVVALIAYLQRLGTDISKTVTEDDTGAAGESTATEAGEGGGS